MRPEIDIHVMQEIGAITRANGPAIEPLSPDICALLESLRIVQPYG
jgi:hypothetical protein